MLNVWDQTVIVMPMKQKITVVVDIDVIANVVCINYVWISVLIFDKVVKAVVIKGDVVHSPDHHKMKLNS